MNVNPLPLPVVKDYGNLGNVYNKSVENPVAVTSLKRISENVSDVKTSSGYKQSKGNGVVVHTSNILSHGMQSASSGNGVVEKVSNVLPHGAQISNHGVVKTSPDISPGDDNIMEQEQAQERNHLALVQMLRQETAELKRKNACLEEANFSLQAEIMCKAAEEKHGRSKVVESLEARLSFQKKELENALEKVRKLEREKTKIRSVNIKVESSKTKIPMKVSHVSVRGKLEKNSAVNAYGIGGGEEEIRSSSKNWKTLVHHLVGNDTTLLEVLRQADKTVSNILYSSLVADVGSTTFIVGAEMRGELIKVASALIDMTCETKKVHSMVLLRKILVIAPTDIVFSIDHSSVKRLFDLLMTVNPNANEEEFSLHKAITDVLLIVSKRPCRPCAIGNFILNQLSNSDMKHTTYTIELYAEVAATQIIQCTKKDNSSSVVGADGSGFIFPHCAVLFQKFSHAHMDTAIVRLCATLIAVMKTYALEQLYKQNLIRELVIVLNRMSTNIHASISRRTSSRYNSGSESPKAAFRATSSLFLLLVRHYLDLKRKNQNQNGSKKEGSPSLSVNLHGSSNKDIDGDGKHELISTLLTISRLDKELKTQVQPMLEELLTLY